MFAQVALQEQKKYKNGPYYRWRPQLTMKQTGKTGRDWNRLDCCGLVNQEEVQQKTHLG